jgi:hypothetical protein
MSCGTGGTCESSCSSEDTIPDTNNDCAASLLSSKGIPGVNENTICCSESETPGGGTPGGGTPGGGTPVGTVSVPAGLAGLPDPAGGIAEILTNILNWMLAIVGILSMTAFVASGVQYLLVSADEANAAKAKKNMTYAVIGTIVALSGFVVVKAVDIALKATGMF